MQPAFAGWFRDAAASVRSFHEHPHNRTTELIGYQNGVS